MFSPDAEAHVDTLDPKQTFERGAAYVTPEKSIAEKQARTAEQLDDLLGPAKQRLQNPGPLDANYS